MGVLRFQNNTDLTYEQWLLERNKTLGASDLGPIVYGSRWTSNIEIFYNKITGIRRSSQNIRTYLGKKTENINREMYCYYDDTEDSIVRNEMNRTPVKEVINLNATIFNSDYPFISVTPDGEIQSTLKYAGRGKGSLELKNTQRYVMQSYANGIPTDNVIQVCGQMMVGQYNYADLFYFLDNRNFEEYPFERKKTKVMEELILSHAVPLWENILKGRILYNQMFEAKRLYNMKLAAEIEKEIVRLEPPVQNTAGYLNFLNERYIDRLANVGILPGTNEQLAIAKKHQELGKKIKKLEHQQQLLEIELKLFIKDNNVLDFGKQGRITWYKGKNDRRFFSNKTITKT